MPLFMVCSMCLKEIYVLIKRIVKKHDYTNVGKTL